MSVLYCPCVCVWPLIVLFFHSVCSSQMREFIIKSIFESLIRPFFHSLVVKTPIRTSFYLKYSKNGLVRSTTPHLIPFVKAVLTKSLAQSLSTSGNLGLITVLRALSQSFEPFCCWRKLGSLVTRVDSIYKCLTIMMMVQVELESIVVSWLSHNDFGYFLRLNLSYTTFR